MPCTPFTLPGGARGFICTRGPRPRCACGRPSTILCDGPSKRAGGTCDKRLCAKCATKAGEDRHLCAGCASGFATAKEAPKPVQEALF